MRYLVTGATGFIGTHVINELVSQNQDVVATSTSRAKAEHATWFKRVKYVECRMEESSEGIDLFSLFGKPDVLINLAWQGLPNYRSLKHIDDNLFFQYFFIKNLIKNGLKNLTNAGTCFEYGLREGILDEEMTPCPQNAYAFAKDSLRQLIEWLKVEYQFNFKWLRLFYMYGAGQNPQSLIPLLEKAIDMNEKQFDMSGGEQLRDYLPVEEMAKIIIKVAGQTKVEGIINCCSGSPITVRLIAEKIRRQHNSEIALNFGAYPYSDLEPMAFWGNRLKLDKILYQDGVH